MQEKQVEIVTINGIPIDEYDFDRETESHMAEFKQRQSLYKSRKILRIIIGILLVLAWVVGIFCLAWFSAPQHTIGYLVGSVFFSIGFPVLALLFLFVVGEFD